MNKDIDKATSHAIERAKRQGTEDKARRDKARREAETSQRFDAAWSVIYSTVPVNEHRETDSLRLESWIVGFNERIEAFVDCVKQTEFAEFLPVLPVRDSHEAIAVGLLNQTQPDRLDTLRELTLPDANILWWVPFKSNLIWNNLISWRQWLNADSWVERYEIYELNCQTVKLASFDDGFKQSAYRTCNEQWNRLIKDSDKPDGGMPTRFDYDAVVGERVGLPSNDQPDVFDPVDDCRANILFCSTVHSLPYSVAQWYEAGCPLDAVPPVDNENFHQLVRELEFQTKLAGERLASGQLDAIAGVRDADTPAKTVATTSLTKKDDLPPPQRRAYSAFQYAAMKLERDPLSLTDHDAWEYLNEHGIESAGEPNEYKLPLIDTFVNYVSKARKALGELKNTKRAGRKGRSTVNQADL